MLSYSGKTTEQLLNAYAEQKARRIAFALGEDHNWRSEIMRCEDLMAAIIREFNRRMSPEFEE